MGLKKVESNFHYVSHPQIGGFHIYVIYTYRTGTLHSPADSLGSEPLNHISSMIVSV